MKEEEEEGGIKIPLFMPFEGATRGCQRSLASGIFHLGESGSLSEGGFPGQFGGDSRYLPRLHASLEIYWSKYRSLPVPQDADAPIGQVWWIWPCLQ